MLFLPDQEGFWDYLHSLTPPNWKENFRGDSVIFAPDRSGLMTVLNEKTIDAYMEESEDFENFTEEDLDESVLWLPY